MVRFSFGNRCCCSLSRPIWTQKDTRDEVDPSWVSFAFWIGKYMPVKWIENHPGGFNSSGYNRSIVRTNSVKIFLFPPKFFFFCLLCGVLANACFLRAFSFALIILFASYFFFYKLRIVLFHLFNIISITTQSAPNSSSYYMLSMQRFNSFY